MKQNLCTIYLVRHGQSEANVPDFLGLDTSLTEKGKGQAKEIAEKFKDTHFDAIFSSPLIRAKQTAEIIRLERKLEVQTVELLREKHYGSLETRVASEVREELKDLYKIKENLPAKEAMRFKIVPDMESDEEVTIRLLTALREIAIVYPGKTVLIASHIGIMKLILVHMGIATLKEMPAQNMENTAYIKFSSDGVDFFFEEMKGVTINRTKKMNIRQYQPSDQKQIRNLHSQALKATNAFYKSGKWDEDLNDIKSIYLNTGGEFLVGLIENKIVAMGALRKISDSVVELKRMRVDPEFQRRGLGQQIYDALEKRAKELGYKVIQLDTTIKQVAAQHFYAKNGYKEMRRETEGWPLETIFYQKKI